MTRPHALVTHALSGDSLLRNSVFVMATTLVNAALGYVFWIAAARIFPASEIGLATALVSALSLTAVIANLGLGSVLIQTLPRRPAGREWSSALTAALLTAAVAGLFAGLVLALLLPSVASGFEILTDDPLLAALLVVGTSLWTAATVLDFAFIAERRAQFMLGRNAIFGAVKILTLVAAVWIGSGDTVVLLAWSVGTAISLGFGLGTFVPQLHRGPVVVVRRLWSTLRAELRLVARSTAGHHLINLGAQLPAFLLPLVVVARDSTTANAYFSITWLVGSLFFTISPAVASSLFAEGSHDAIALPHLAARSGRYIALLLVGPMIGLAILGPWVLGLFGEAYADAGYGLLLVLIVSAVPDAVTNVYVSSLRVRHELGRAAVLNLTMATVSLGWAWWRVPTDGIIAAGWGWLLAQMLGACIALLDGRRVLRTPIAVARHEH